MSESDDNNHQFNQHNSSGPGALVLLVIGVILLLNNFGIINWIIWETLWKFWPVILIFWGLKEMSVDSKLLSFVFGIINLVVIIFVITYSLAATDANFKNWLEEKYPIWTRILQVEPKELRPTFSA